MARNRFDVDEKLETPFNIKHLKRTWVYIKRHKWKMLLSLILSALSTVASLYIPKITQWVLDEAVPAGDKAMIGRMAILFITVIMISIAFVLIRSRIMAHVSHDIIYDIRKDLFAHLQRLPHSYYDNRPAGKVLVRVINYVNSVSNILSNGIINMILEIMNIAFIIVFMFLTNVKLSLVIIAGLPLFVAYILFIKPRQRKAWQAVSNKGSNYNAYLAESIDGVRVSQMFVRQETNIGIMAKLVEAWRKVWMRAIYLSNTVWLVSGMLNFFAICGMYIVGVYFMGDGVMVSTGVILAMTQYAGRFWTPITNLANIYNDFVNNIAYLERIFETMDEKVTVDDKENADVLPEITGEVDFKDITFGYEEGIDVLRDVSLHVRPGESIALVGPTGAGKSTVINLLCRFYDVNKGGIYLTGKDGKQYELRDVTIKSLRNQLGIMLQDSFLFSGSIEDCIRYGKLDATEEEVREAARKVHADDFISKLPGGYKTKIMENGSNLSQGERQLLAFARTLVSDPRILILDEATSSIDTQTEKMLQEGIREMLKNRTSFIVAHRLSTIRSCDKILYIGNKGIMEAGSHDELMAKKGYYYQLYMAQKSGQ